MAQSQAVLAEGPGAVSTSKLSEKDIHDIQQYEQIVQFRDAILSGTHPTIKLPAATLAALQGNGKSFQRNSDLPAQDAAHLSESAKPTYGSGSTAINPLLLEKSADLVKAEFNIQRQRIERALKDEVEQRRGNKPDKAEPIADYDLTEVLAKALKIVQETLPANDEAASDSFDDNTFYSSEHETPDSKLTSRVRGESELVQQQTASETQPSSLPQASHQPEAVRNDGPQSVSNSLAPSVPAQAPPPFQVPGLNNYTKGGVQTTQTSQTNVSQDQSRFRDLGVPDSNLGPSQTWNSQQQLDDAYVETHPPSPLIRTHDIVPVAPQPASAYFHAVEEQLVPAADNAGGAARGAPAQVAALRNEPIAINSPDSSPQSGRSSEKRKGKKKKRKADRQAPEEVIPYIKPEPRSPSPMNAPTYIRPSKRQKQTQRQGAEVEQGAVPVTNSSPVQYEPRLYAGEPAQVTYGQPRRAATTTYGAPAGYGGAYVDDGRHPAAAYVGHQPRYIQRPASTTYSTRAPSHVVVDDGYREAPRAYQPYESGRVSVRPEGDPYMGQPMPPPTRIIVDSMGREYIEPSRPSMRQSVAPPSYGHEVVYERPPPRAISRHPGQPMYDDGRSGLVYTRASSAYPVQRRVVTQPEYASQDYRPRDYSARPGPATEYVQVMAPPSGQPGDEGYDTRAQSTRPMEPVRYEMSRDYGRVQSVRPEASAPEYAGSVHPEAHAQQAQPYAMEYAPRPAEQPVYQHGYSVRPVEQYYNGPPGRGGEELAYVERPRGATQEIVYADDARREVYR